jgi:uncharacterized protein (TIGR03437 family)
LAIILLLCFSSLNALRAQGSAVSVNPSQLIFNVQSGSGASPSQNLFVSSTTSTAVSFTATAFSGGNWLSVTPGSGTTPQVLSVVVNPGSLAPGSYNGFINIASPNGNVFASVPVTMNINVTGASPFTASPSSLSFGFQSGATIPQSQPLSVSLAAGGSAAFTATASTGNNGNWLSVNPSSATTPATLNVSVDPSSLGAGTFSGSITINSTGSSGLVIPVSVTVGAASTLNVAPAQLSFAFQLGAAAPVPQTLTLTSVGGGTISFTATPSTSSCGSSWLVVSPLSSATPSTLSVQINPAGLQAANCSGTIIISAPGASNPTVSIPVSLLVSANPLLQVPSTGTTFNYQLGTAQPAAQTVQVTSSGAPLNFTVSATPLSAGPNFLTILPTSGTTPQGIALSVTPSVLAALAPNTYVETVTVTSPGAGNSPQSFPVTLVVSTNPTLVASQTAATFNFQIGQAPPPAQTVTITSTGAPLNYTASVSTTSCPGFLNVSPVSGTTQVQTGQSSQVAIGVNTSNLTTPQTCAGTVTLSVPGSTSGPLTIPVTLNVSTTPLINLSPSAINAVAVTSAGAITTQNIAVTSTDGTTSLNFTATAATNPPGLTWLSVTPNSGTTPSNLVVTLNPSNLAPGVYMGTINVSSSSPNVPSQTIPVTLFVATGTITVTPASLAFNQALNGPAPASRTLQVTGVPTGATVGASAIVLNGSNWLTVSTSGTAITVTANGSQLSSGSYSGVVTVFVPGASNSPLYIPVSLTVGGPPPFTIFPSTLNFNVTAGSTTLPGPQTVQLSGSGGVQFNAVAVAPPGSAGGVVFVTVTPASGTAPAPLSIGLNAAAVSALAPGNYANTVNITSPGMDGAQSITVLLNVAAPGPPSISAVLSGASFQSGVVSPGEIVSIFGANIGPGVAAGLQLTSNGTIATTLSNTSVTFNGFAAPLLFVSSGQINIVVPYEIAGSATASVVVNRNGVNSAPVQVNVAAATPALFTLNQSGGGQGAILNQDFSVNGPNNAAARGSIIILYATGEGVVTPAAPTGSVTPIAGPFPKPVGAVTVMIGGVQAQVLFAGEAPGYTAGLLQVNAVVPTTIGAGNQPLVLTVGNSVGSSAVTATIK